MRVRLLMAALPPMLSDIVRALAARESGIEVIGEVAADADLCAAVEAADADVVLIGVDRPAPVPGELLAIRGPLRVLTLTDGGRIGYLDRMLPHRTVLEDLSPEDLFLALLGVGRFGPAATAPPTPPN